MRTQRVLLVLAASLAVIGLGTSDIAIAHSGGAGGGGHGGGAGGHFGGGGHFGVGGHGFAGRGGYTGGYGRGWHGSYGGWHGTYGYRGGWGGYGWRGGYGGWGWGGLGIGLYFATLPYYYSTLWAGGVPYYYADDNYFQWDSTVGQYETVDPPADVKRQAATLSPDLIAYPKNGQTGAQQVADKSECRKWASAQSGFDPSQSTAAGTTTGSTTKRSDYMRAQAACLDGRGYSVE
jgi:hypothetical protein